MRVLYLTSKTQLRTGNVVHTCKACVTVLGSIPKEREGSERDKQAKTQIKPTEDTTPDFRS